MSDVFTVLGFGLAVTGIWLLGGPGWACLVAGVVLFVSGGLASRKAPKR